MFGVVGNPGLQTTVFPILEVDYGGLDPDLPPILGYESQVAARFAPTGTISATGRRKSMKRQHEDLLTTRWRCSIASSAATTPGLTSARTRRARLSSSK